MRNLEWLNEIEGKVYNFISSMQSDRWSYVKYAYDGDLFSSKFHWGLANYVFATKILYTLGRLDKNAHSSLAEKMMTFEYSQGLFHDPVLGKIPNKLLRILAGGNSTLDNAYGETRQVYVALKMLGVPYQKEFLFDSYLDESKVKKRLNELDWKRPWHSGSQAATLLFYLNHNFQVTGSTKYKSLISYILTFFEQMRTSEGAWGDESATSDEKINGAMKVLMGLHSVGIYNFSRSEDLLDFVLKQVHNKEACYNFNVIHVLYSCWKNNPNYRFEDIKEFMLNKLEDYKHFFHSDLGGFSFHINRSNDILYGTKVSLGKNCPDIHGTNMFLLGIAQINETLNLGLGLNVTTH
jgi:hypothetical protein